MTTQDHPGNVFVYDITYVLAPDGDTTHTRRVTVTDPYPQPGFGPSLGIIHQALRDSDPHEFGHIQHPDELAIITVKTVTD
jgi:hypothetical protein